MLPLGLLKAGQGHPILVELKNGETYNGHLVNCDSWMNVHLKEDGDRFWRIAETYIRGNTIKYIRVPDEVVDKAQDDPQAYIPKPAEEAPPRSHGAVSRGRRTRGPLDRGGRRWPSGRGQSSRGRG